MQFFSPPNNNALLPATNSGLAIDIFTIPSGSVQLTLPSAFQSGQYPLSSMTYVYQSQDPSLSNFTINLPDASLASSWIGTLVYNATGIDLIILDYVIGAVVTIPDGRFYSINLIDNSSPAGNWISLNVGTGTSANDASALAGYGLFAAGSKLNVFTQVSSITASRPIVSSDEFSLINYAGTGSASINLPTFYSGFGFFLKNSSPGLLTVTAPGITSIDGQQSVNLFTNQGAYITTNGTNWYTIGLNNINSTGAELSSTGIKVVNGSPTQPSYSFINNANSGFYTNNSNIVGVTINGSSVGQFTSQGLNITNGNIFENGIPVLLLAGLYP